MLETLSIRNVVLIEALDIDVQAGLSALTGETGAGKSILLDALGLALGARAETGLVRKGADQASVAATFSLPATHPVFALLAEQEITPADAGRIDLRRTLSSDGRSKAFINDQPVGVGVLRQAGDLIVDIHGQFETHGLMDVKTHAATLDAFAGTLALREAVSAAWKAWKEARRERDALAQAIEAARADQDYWQSAYEDLAALDIKENEEDALLERRTMLSAREHIVQGFGEACAMLDDGDASAAPLINRAWRVLERLGGKAGDRLQPALDALDRAVGEIRTATEILQGWFDDADAGPDSLEAVDDRLHELRGQARKHQCHVADLPRVRDDIAGRLTAIRGDDGRMAELERAVARTEADYRTAAKKLSAERQNAAKMLDQKVMAELPPLKLEKARFETQVIPMDESAWGEGGMDQVQFVVATNAGSEAGAINKIASGGELSRFMLAIKVALAETSSVPVMIFDEVDAGIGGATADAVGACLARLADTGRQVLAITHSP